MKTYDKVLEILRSSNDPSVFTATRMIKELYAKYHGVYVSTYFGDVMDKIDKKEIPSFETIRRSMQKVRENNPELRFRKDLTEQGYSHIQEEAHLDRMHE